MYIKAVCFVLSKGYKQNICNLPIKLPLYTGNNLELRLLIGYSFVITRCFFRVRPRYPIEEIKMLQHSAFTLSAPAPAVAGQISRHMVKGWLGELFMSLALVAAGVGILAASARIRVPFYPIPVTMQTLAVMVIAMAYGSKLGTATLFSYLLTGFWCACICRWGFCLYGRANRRLSGRFPCIQCGAWRIG